MNAPKTARCLCVATHEPAPLDLDEHHVWPLGMGGPDVALNRVWLCPTAHRNAHEILREMVRVKRALTWSEVLDMFETPVSRYAYRVALLGFRRWQNHGLEGSLL